MNKREFLAKAKRSISNIPRDRLSKPVQKVLKRDRFICDAHIHVFDGKCVDEKYFILRLIFGQEKKASYDFLATVYPSFTSHIKFENFNVEEFVYKEDHFHNFSSESLLGNKKSIIEPKDVYFSPEMLNSMNKGARAIALHGEGLLKILHSGRMETVYENYEKKHQLTSEINRNYDTLTIALGMDLNTGWNYGRTTPVDIPKNQNQQNLELLNLSGKNPVIPFFPADPRRKDLYEAFLKAFSEKSRSQFYGIKLYPALGYAISDPKLDPIFEICNLKSIPIVSHCGGSIVSTFQETIKINENGKKITVPGRNRNEKANYLNSPERWKIVLDRYSNLHVNLAHFAGNKQWEKSTNKLEPRISAILKLMKSYQVYSDFSFSLKSNRASLNFVRQYTKGPNSHILQERTFHGTDYWVVLPTSNLMVDQKRIFKLLKGYRNKFFKNSVLSFLYLNDFELEELELA